MPRSRRRGEVIVIVVWAVDRWTRGGIADLITDVDLLKRRGVSGSVESGAPARRERCDRSLARGTPPSRWDGPLLPPACARS
jgi:hypothetical protein